MFLLRYNNDPDLELLERYHFLRSRGYIDRVLLVELRARGIITGFETKYEVLAKIKQMRRDHNAKMVDTRLSDTYGNR